jgi:undecaprenyl-diphosphatase
VQAGAAKPPLGGGDRRLAIGPAIHPAISFDAADGGLRAGLLAPLTRPRVSSAAVLRRIDTGLLRAMRTRGHTPALESAMRVIATAGEWGAIWTAGGLAAAVIDAGRRERWVRAACVAPLAVSVNYGVKLAVGRRRPRLRGLPPLCRAPSRLSFPSAHATSSLAAAAAMARISPRAAAPLYGLAAAICVTRPYLGVHYPSDVLAGAALGLALGRAWPGLGGGPPIRGRHGWRRDGRLEEGLPASTSQPAGGPAPGGPAR